MSTTDLATLRVLREQTQQTISAMARDLEAERLQARPAAPLCLTCASAERTL